MSQWELTKTQMQAGHWAGVITGAAAEPAVAVTHLDQPVAGIQLESAAEEGTWVLNVPIPASAIADGVQTLLITDAATDTVVERITLIAGDTLGDDLRAEVDLLRAELDMLKRAFRRHCLETA